MILIPILAFFGLAYAASTDINEIRDKDINEIEEQYKRIMDKLDRR